MAALSFFYLFFNLGSGSLASWDEAFYAVVSRELFQSGQWLKLTFLGEPWFDKPPLVFWATSLAYHFLGVSEFSSRFFSALCGVGTVLVTHWLGSKLFDRWTGFCGALVLLSSSHFIRFARFGMTDSPLTFFMTLTLLFFWLGREQRKYLIFSGIALGAALMTKGVVALLVFPVVWVYAWGSKRASIFWQPTYWLGLLAAFLIAAPWQIYQAFSFSGDFIGSAFFHHVLHRATTVMDGHQGSFYFYIRTLINKYHPWIVIGIFSAPWFLWKALREREERALFLSCWIFIIWAAFSLAQTKLAWYIFPIYPALSLTVAFFLTKILKEKYRAHTLLVFAAILFLHSSYSHIHRMEYSRPLKASAAMVLETVPKKAIIYLYNYHEQPAAAYYFERPIKYLESRVEFDAAVISGEPFYCFIREKELAELGKISPSLSVLSTGAGSEAFLITHA